MDGELDVVEEQVDAVTTSSKGLPLLKGEFRGRSWVLLERQVEATGDELGPKEMGSLEAPGTMLGFRIFIGSGKGMPGI